MPAPDYSHRRSMKEYLAANFRTHWQTDMHTTAADLDDWYKEISAFLRDAAAEYPVGHPDRLIYETALPRIKLTYEGFTRFKKDLLGRSPTVVVGEIDTAYTSTRVASVVKLPPVPISHSREWSAHNYLFVNCPLALDAQDINSLYAAMMQDPTSGTSTTVGGSARHLTSNARGSTGGLIWYVHQGRNRLLGISACNPAARTITVTKTGNVNAGTHVFS